MGRNRPEAQPPGKCSISSCASQKRKRERNKKREREIERDPQVLSLIGTEQWFAPLPCCIPQMRHYVQQLHRHCRKYVLLSVPPNARFIPLLLLTFQFLLFILHFTLYQSRRRVSRHDGPRNNNCHLQLNSLKRFNVAAFRRNFYNWNLILPQYCFSERGG